MNAASNKFWQRYVPLGLSGLILLVIAATVPWHQVAHELRHFPLSSLILLTLLGIIYYLSKGVRFWVMLRQLGLKQPIGPMLLLYLSGYPASLLPAGEIYRGALLKNLHDIPLSRSSPIVIMQGVVEGIIVLGVAIVSTVALGKSQVVLLPIVLLLGFGIWALKTQNTGKLVAKLPFINMSRYRIRKFTEDNKVLLSRQKLPLLLLLSCIPEICGVAMVWVAAGGVGLHLDLAQAAISYSVPLAISAISLLPGGLGASEGSTLGIFKLLHATTAVATAATLIIRIFTLGMGLILGFLASAFLPRTSKG